MNKTYTPEQLRRLARNHRLVLWCIFAIIIATGILIFLPVSKDFRSIILPVAILPIVVLYWLSLYRLAKSLELSLVWYVLFLVGQFIPLLGLLVLLTISDKASKVLKLHGLKVGLMGTDPQSIEND
jgi:hypothetical protein